MRVNTSMFGTEKKDLSRHAIAGMFFVVFIFILLFLLAYYGTRYNELDRLSEENINQLADIADYRLHLIRSGEKGVEITKRGSVEEIIRYRSNALEETMMLDRFKESSALLEEIYQKYLDKALLLSSMDLTRLGTTVIIEDDIFELITDLNALQYNLMDESFDIINMHRLLIFDKIKYITLSMMIILLLFILYMFWVIYIVNKNILTPIIKASSEIRRHKVDNIKFIETENLYCRDLFREIHFLNKSLAHNLQEKSIFLSTMSHEIRTPLNSIILNVESLNEKYFGDEILEDIKYASDFLLQVINNVLDYSKFDSSFRLKKDNFQPLRTFDSLTSLSSILGTVAKRQGVNIWFYIGKNFPLEFRTVAVYFNQILVNILTNSIYHSGSRRINVRFLYEVSHVKITLTDFGNGISKDGQIKLKDPLAQTKNQRVTGSGLGLTVSMRLAKLLGGEVRYVTQLGRGTRFVLRIPNEYVSKETFIKHFFKKNKEIDFHYSTPLVKYQRYHRVKAKRGLNVISDVVTPMYVFELKKGAFAEQKETESLLPFPVNILVVDDYQMNLKAMSRVLKRLGANFTLVQSGEKALAALRQSSFDLVLMDIQMPGMDGVEATRKIKGVEEFATLPIIGLSADTDEALEARCIDVGMQALKVKPLAKKQLLSIIKSLAISPPRPA